MKLYRDVDYFIYFEDFPCMGTRGFVGSNVDGTSSIYINTLYCEPKQRECLRHELRHVALDHLWRDDMEEKTKESEADGITSHSFQFASDFSWVEVTAQVGV